MNTLDQLLLDTIQASRKDETPPEALGWKLSEEVGEFGESGLKENGYLRHKREEDVGPMLEEFADIMNVAIATIVATPKFRAMSDDELVDAIKVAWRKKLDKYEHLIELLGGFGLNADVPSR